MKKLEGKVVVVTGGTTGIGFATARAFADEGAKVVATGRASVDAARRAFEGRVDVVAADATKVSEIARLFEYVKERYGRIDVLFVNVGGGAFRPLEAIDEQYFDDIVTLNFKSAFFTVREALPLLGKGSSVVLNTSVTGNKGFASTSVYGASKAAVRQLARSLGSELVARGIRINAVSPGPIDTPIYDKLGLGENKQAFMSNMTQNTPMKRFGTAEEVARAVVFLGTDESSFVTGAELAVDGGVVSF